MKKMYILYMLIWELIIAVSAIALAIFGNRWTDGQIMAYGIVWMILFFGGLIGFVTYAVNKDREAGYY